MRFLRRAVKLRLPLLERIYGRYLEIYRLAKWQFNSVGTISRRRFMQYEGKHTGQRCFIIGNGPSLRNMDLSPLKHEVTFGMNRIYLLFPELNFTTNYYVTVNPNVIEQFSGDIVQLPMPKFVGWRKYEYLQFTDDMMVLPLRTGLSFAHNPAHGVWEGWTVTYVSMQLAYYMGFSQVYLIGVDHNFATQGRANELVVSTGDDPNHFHPNYFGKGYKWQLPDLEGSERAYRLAKAVYERAGRKIFDATVDGKLDIFPKVEYTSLFT